MIVSGWDLHVYCGHKGCTRRDEFGGISERDAKRQARENGWKFASGDVFCKEHAPPYRVTVLARATSPTTGGG